MARSCGFRIGPRRFELVVLDGSPKRHKIAAYYSGEFSPEAAAAFAEGDVSGVASVLKEAARTHRIPVENVTVVMASDQAAFRRLTLPFSDRSKIDQVLKFEIESELPQFDIEDVVVDYHVMSENEAGAELLVSAVPKDDIHRTLLACEKAGFEPLEVELEATAMVNAALAADICHIDDAQLLVHVGEHSTCVAVVAGAEIRELRVIHIGAMSHLAKELDLAAGEPLAAADDEGDEGGEGDEAAEAPSGADALEELDPIEASRRIDQAIKRIRREIGRTISAARTSQPIEAIYACGMELPGLIGGSVLDVPVYVLDCFEEDSGQPADGFGELVAAYGGAFRQLGGGAIQPSLRRDELRYTGTWERLEFPVAFAVLMLTTFLGMVYILQMREISAMRDHGTLQYLQNINYFIVGDGKRGGNPILNPVPKDLADRAEIYRETKVTPLGVNMPLEEIRSLKASLQQRLVAIQTEVGDIQEIPLPPSAFAAMTCVLNVMRSDPTWRPSLRALKADYEQANSRENLPEHIKVRLDVTFFATDTAEASSHIDAFDRALRDQPWCLDVASSTTEPISGGGGLYVQGKNIRVDPSKFFDARSN
ncbi:MAG: pilus assembly protein PilM [Planctomycetota bacterium]